MIWVVVLVQLAALGTLAVAWQRVDTARRVHDECCAEIAELEKRVTGLDVRLIPKVRDVIAQSRRAEGVTMPIVRFAHKDASVVRVFDTESVYDLGHIVGANIPSACFGEGTCGLCLVRVTEGADQLDPPTENEEILRQANAIHDPAVRLACHLRPTTNITVTTDIS